MRKDNYLPIFDNKINAESPKHLIVVNLGESKKIFSCLSFRNLLHIYYIQTVTLN